MAHLHVPRNLDLGGTRLTVLATRAEMSKQAMGEIVDQCAALGLVTRLPDKSDRRAKIVVFTPRGLRLIEVVRAALSSAESEMLAEIGAQRMRAMMIALTHYADNVGTRRRRVATPLPGVASRRARAPISPAR